MKKTSSPSFLKIILILSALISSFFLACAGKMSLEEARQVAVSMGDKSLVAPPRRIDDIMATLDQSDPGYSALHQKLRTEIEKPVPQTDDPAALSAFYLRRGDALEQMGRFSQALADLRLALDYSSQAGIKDYQLLRSLADCTYQAGNFKQGIEYFEESLSLKEWTPAYKGLVKLYARIGDLESAKRLADRGISLCNRLRNQPGWEIWSVVHTAEMKASVLEAQAKFAEAEPYYRQILQSWTPSMKMQYPLGYVIRKVYLARNLKDQGRLVEAEVVCRDHLKAVSALNRDSEAFGFGLSELGVILIGQGRLQDAEKLLRKSVRMMEGLNVDPESYLMAGARMRLGEVLAAEQKFDEAMQQFDFAKADMQKNQYLYENFFARNPALMFSLVRTGRIQEATQQISEIYTKDLELFGESHYLTAEILGLRGIAHALQKNDQEALKDFSKAFPALIEQGTSTMLSYDRQIRLQIILESYLDVLVRLKRGEFEKDDGMEASSQAFKIADALSGSNVRSAIGASAARAAATSPELAELVRQVQDTQKQLEVFETALSNNLAAPVDQQLPQVIEELKSKIETLTRAHRVLVEEINARFPKYAELTHPKPVGILQVQKHLHLGEAFVAIYTADDHSYVWAIPHQGRASFCSVPLGKAELSQMVSDFRSALDPKPVTLGDIPEFNTSIAYDLYRQLLEPVEKGWRGATDLLVVAHGPLGQLPFAVLPTAPVALGDDEAELFSKYRQVPWLIRKMSITRLPSAT